MAGGRSSASCSVDRVSPSRLRRHRARRNDMIATSLAGFADKVAQVVREFRVCLTQVELMSALISAQNQTFFGKRRVIGYELRLGGSEQQIVVAGANHQMEVFIAVHGHGQLLGRRA